MLYINLNRNSQLSLTKQIYYFFKENILNGTFKQDEKLPSTRELAKSLNVARNIIIESYEQLIAEGYAYSKSGSGTYISTGVFLQRLEPQKINSKQATVLSDIISFRTGIPDLSSIPIKKWGKLYKKITLTITAKEMDYQPPFGANKLREQLALYLKRIRGVNTTPDNILITNGAAQAFNLICRFITNDNYALVENPLSYGILHTLKVNKIRIEPISLDNNGMITAKLPNIPPQLIFTTPSHQFPTGVILPINRRIEMIQYARKHNAYIVEDDYDSEFRFDGDPIQSMQGLDPERVIYIGTFSKTLMPALRIGYMVLPNILCQTMQEAKYAADIHSPILEQLTLAQYIEDGLFDKHIHKMKRKYFKRRNYLIKCLKEVFKDKVAISGAESGMHLIASFKDIYFTEKIMKHLKDQGIEITNVRKHYYLKEDTTAYDNCLIIGYGNTDFASIKIGVNRLAKLFID